MGNCSCESQQRSVATINGIIDALLRIRITCEQHQLRDEQAVRELEELLAQVFVQETAKRSRMTEKAMIGRTVFARNKIIIYCYVENEARKLLERRGLFEMEQSYADLAPSINVLTYCSTFLGEESLARFTALIQQRFPEYRLPGDSDIAQGLIQHHRHTEEVTFEMENDFVLQFCAERGIELVRVNAVGHGYHYGAGSHAYQ